MFDLKRYGNAVAAIGENHAEVTYEQLHDIGEEMYGAVGRRCLVFCLCENSVGAVLGYAAFLNHAVVPVMLSAHLDDELLSNLMDTYHPAYVWLPESERGRFDKHPVIYEAYGYMLVDMEYEKIYPLNEKLALLLTTSGSTGSPKFVRQSYENIRANTESIIEYLCLDSSERPITTLPMNYTYGLSIINTHLSVGAALLLTDKTLMQKEFWEFFKTGGATSFGGVPYTYEMLDKLRFFRMDLPSLRTMTQAGGKLTPELHEKFASHAAEKGICFVVMYGQCEATARMGYLPSEMAVKKRGSMGIAIPGGKFTLVDVKGDEIKDPHRTGELVYEGPNVTLGYAERGEDLILGDERHGRLETGDMAERDEDGYYYIVGRKKRFLKIYGNRVNLDEMDRLIKGRYEVDVACSGVDDHMYVFIAGDMADRADEIKRFAAQKTGLNPAAFTIKAIDEIPKNDSGKTLYEELTQYYDI